MAPALEWVLGGTPSLCETLSPANVSHTVCLPSSAGLLALQLSCLIRELCPASPPKA